MNLYKILGVAKNATPAAIIRAFRAKSKKLHPDANNGATEEEFRALSRAYAVLKDPRRRAHYDATGDEEGPRSEPTPEEKRRAELRSFLMGRFAELMSNDHVDPTHDDVLDLLCVEVEGHIDAVSKEVKRLEKNKMRIETTRARFVHKAEGEDVVASAHNVILDKIQAGLDKAREAHALFIEAKALLEGYTYKVDPRTAEAKEEDWPKQFLTAEMFLVRPGKGFMPYGAADS